VQFGADAPIDRAKVITLIQKDRNTRMAGQDKLVQKIALPELRMRAAAVRLLLESVKA
jgi:transcription-repair coupling factor (superfamily II helicase)